MKYLFCSYDGRGYFGGPYEWLKRLGPELRRRGHEVTFAFLADHKAGECATISALREAGFSCRWLERHSLSQYSDNTETRVRWFIQQARFANPDIFIPNAVLEAVFAGDWIRQAGVPTVAVVHSQTDAADEYYRGLYSLMNAESGRFAPSAIVGVSRAIAAEAQLTVGDRSRIEQIACGAPVPDATARAPGGGLLRVAYVGQFTEHPKRIGDVTRALCRVTRAIPRTEGILYGDGRDRRIVDEILGCENPHRGVQVAGQVPSSGIQSKLLECHVIILLSEYEGLPIALMEAMACGVVPVCFDISGGVAELVRDGETGILISDRDDSVLKAVGALRRDQALWQRLSENARKLIIEHYSMERVGQQWEALGARLLSESRTRAALPGRVRLNLPPPIAQLAAEDVRRPSTRDYIRLQLLRLRRHLAA